MALHLLGKKSFSGLAGRRVHAYILTETGKASRKSALPAPSPGVLRDPAAVHPPFEAFFQEFDDEQKNSLAGRRLC